MSFRALSLLAPLALVLFAGCHIESHGPHGHGGMWTDFEHAGRAEVCSAFCDRLFTCGNVSDGQFDTCMSTCEDRFDEAEDATREGCQCVTWSSCQPSDGYACEGAPMPDLGPGSKPGQATDAGSTDTSSGGSDAGGSKPDTGTSKPMYTCASNADCVSSEDCIAGYCLVRCKASCECHSQESCVGGYCSVTIVPAQSCANDCDCPAGGKCVQNQCQ